MFCVLIVITNMNSFYYYYTYPVLLLHLTLPCQSLPLLHLPLPHQCYYYTYPLTHRCYYYNYHLHTCIIITPTPPRPVQYYNYTYPSHTSVTIIPNRYYYTYPLTHQYNTPVPFPLIEEKPDKLCLIQYEISIFNLPQERTKNQVRRLKENWIPI